MVRVWDPLVRIFHWTLVICIAVAWITDHSSEAIHQSAGYTAAALVSVRLIWGFIGSPYARFRQFVRAPSVVRNYLAAIARGDEARYVGHNPAGGAMIVVLLTAIAATAISGWLMTTDTFYGEDWVEAVHSTSAYLTLALIALHVAGVLLASLRHHENLVRAMITGRKRQPLPEDVV
jgi:cytochrome b